MRLSVKNFGIIRDAVVDLGNDLVLFAGPNGTGKTYVAYLLNALYNCIPRVAPSLKYDDVIGYLRNELWEIKMPYIQSWALQLEKQLIDRIPSVFGLSKLESMGFFGESEIRILIDDEDLKRVKEANVKFKLYLGSNKLLSCFKKRGETCVGFHIEEGLAEKSLEENENYLSLMFGEVLRDALTGRWGSRMLTVERNSIYTFKTELSLNRIETVDRILISEHEDAESIAKSRSDLYPEVVRKSLAVANDLVNVVRQESEFSEFAEEIEQYLLSGSVNVGENGDVRFVPDGGSNTTDSILPIKMSSSSVKTLSGLVMYLKHLARKGEVLIVDEPEMNLHPDNQRRLARIFARMVNEGLRLVISTHSDYIIREFNNLIMAHTLKAKQEGDVSERLGYSDSELIDKNCMSAYLFNFDGEDRVAVKEINIDDYGFEVSTIDKTIERQNEATLMLRDTLDAL